MQKRHAFTLVELLVVIAIIALLMSILMPALSRVRKQAKATICLAHLHQWGLMFSMCAEENDNRFKTTGRDGYWLVLTRPYLNLRPSLSGQEDKHDMYFCPTATQIDIRYGGKGQNPFSAWRYTYYGNIYYGSYGFNAWLYDFDDPQQYQDRDATSLWRKLDVKGTNNIPVLLPCFHGGGCPEQYDDPPDYDGQRWAGGHNDEMRRFCLNRHDGFVNCLFLDWSVRKVGLKELWTLKWHRKYEINGPWTVAGGARPRGWPEWMRNFKDY